MSADMTKLVKLSALDNLASIASAAINDVVTIAADGIKKVVASGNTINFYKNKNAVVGTDTADFTFDFPSELVLDAANTTFEPDFEFSTATYGADTIDPNLDGKPVLVLVVKTTTASSATSTAYSFLNLYDLVDIYKQLKPATAQKHFLLTVRKLSSKFLQLPTTLLPFKMMTCTLTSAANKIKILTPLKTTLLNLTQMSMQLTPVLWQVLLF